MIQLFYSVGILCGYCLMITPTFKIINHIPMYHALPEFSMFGKKNMKQRLLRVVIVILCCTLAYNIPDLGQFLNFQGSITGILMTFIFPIACYFKVFWEKISPHERYMCYSILAYGMIGGTVSASYALYSLVMESKNM